MCIRVRGDHVPVALRRNGLFGLQAIPCELVGAETEFGALTELLQNQLVFLIKHKCDIRNR